MIFGRLLIGVVCSVIGTVPAYVFYTKSNAPSGDQSSLMIGMVVAAIICLSAFIGSRYFFKKRLGQNVAAVVGTYSLLVLTVIIGSIVQGQLAETLMWLPIMILFGVPAMAPLMAMTWLGTNIIFGKKKDRPEQIAARDKSVS